MGLFRETARLESPVIPYKILVVNFQVNNTFLGLGWGKWAGQSLNRPRFLLSGWGQHVSIPDAANHLELVMPENYSTIKEVVGEGMISILRPMKSFLIRYQF